MNSKKINKTILYIVDALILISGIFLDRLSKYYAFNKLNGHPSVSLISGVLELRYLENTGAAFGLLKNQLSFFILVAVVVLMACLYVIIKAPGRKKYIAFSILVTCIATGALGNLIDRFMYGYVIDFIYFSIINFPIFNVADIFVTLPTIIFVFLFIFVYKEDDLNFLMFKEKKLRDVN